MSTRYEHILEQEKRWKRLLYQRFPAYQFSNDYYEDVIKGSLTQGCRWVDSGCGKNELIYEFDELHAASFGLDRSAHPNLQKDKVNRFLQGDVSHLPFQSDSIDLFSSNMMLEHIEKPADMIAEMKRSLKPGGMMVLRTPNAWHVLNVLKRFVPEGLKKSLIRRVFGVASEDVFPTYYRANRIGALRRLCQDAGFNSYEVVAFEDVHTAFGFFFYLSMLFYRIVRIRPLAFLRMNFVVMAKK
ncbi:MAG: class I SAM-dependent methyltransferase [bacterium]